MGSNDGKLYALNAVTGAKIWDYAMGYAIFSSPAVVNGVVYMGGGGIIKYMPSTL